MRVRKLFTKTSKTAPADEVAKNAQLLIRAGCKLFMMALTLMILHVLYLLCSGFVKYLRK